MKRNLLILIAFIGIFITLSFAMGIIIQTGFNIKITPRSFLIGLPFSAIYMLVWSIEIKISKR